MSKTILLMLMLLTVSQFRGSAQMKNDQNMKTDTMTATDDEAAIRALEANFVSALNTGDIDAMMKNYVQDKSFVIFDVVPRKEYHGADVYREDWVDFFSHFKGTPKLEIASLGITVDGSVGFSYSIQHVTGTDKEGHPVDRWVRVTDGYRKIDGKWLIALEHVSVPVDLRTGMAAPVTKP
jgi:ketosteroid isomerase-like protein